MFDRLLPTDIFRAQWKALSDYRNRKTVPDVVTRLVVVAVPVGVFAACLVTGFDLKTPEGVLTAMAVLIGGFLAAFAHLSPVRVHLAERENMWGDAERFDRDAIDETCAHLLAGSYVAGCATLVLILGMNLGADPKTGALTGVWAATASGLMAYEVIIFMIAMPRLYQAYASYSRVRKELSGTHRGSF